MKPKINQGKYTQSTFDCDFYKINMQWAYMMKFPDSRCSFEYTLRSDVQWPKGFGAALQYLFNQYGELRAPDNAEKYLLDNAPHLPLAAIDYLINFRYNPAELQIFHDEKENTLRIKAEGPTVSAMRWEIPVLSTVSELFHEMTGNGLDDINVQKATTVAAEKGTHLNMKVIPHVDFGSRRRHSYQIHEQVTKALSRAIGNAFIGTSNMHIAMKHNLKMIGTTGHEWHQFHAGVYGYKMANYRAMENWNSVYQGRMGIVLPDTFTTDSFLASFDTYHGRLYDGARQDSGDWKAWTLKFYNKYKELGIDPTSKNYVYSDGINSMKLCEEMRDHSKNLKISFSLGIGTWFTCDIPEVKPMNQVMKMTSMSVNRYSDWVYVIKIADGVGKEIGDKHEIKLAKLTLKIPQQKPIIT